MKQIVLFFIDLILLYASLVATLAIRYDSNFSAQYHIHLPPFIIIFSVWLLVFYIAGLFDARNFRNNIHFYSLLFQTIATASVISVIFFYSIPVFGITPKTNLLIFIILFTGLTSLSRWLFNSVVETRFKKLTLIVSSSEQGKELANYINENPQLGYELKAIVDPSTDLSNLSQLINSQNISTVVIGAEAYQFGNIIDLFYKSLNRKINFYNLSTFYELLTGMVPLGAINQVWFLENLSEGNKKAYEVLKRGADILFGSVFGVISLAFYPFIGLAIKLSSRGPLFYSQNRIGQLGTTFPMMKFRTMVSDAEKNTGAVWAGDNDSRVTKVGKFLRKTRLDEIPQLWNIVRGDMSMVGPRAERPEFHGMLKEQVPFYEERYLIKPGLTGWAQINFHYGSSVSDAAEKLKYDLYYIKNRSLLLDFGIVLKTIRIALQQSGK